MRGDRQPGRARGRGRLARLLRLGPARRRPRAVGVGRRAPRHRRGRASRSTSGCSTPRGAGCSRSRSTSRSTTSTASRSSARRWPSRSTCSAQQHDEQLRARSRGAFLSELADGRVEEADARRRAEALGLSASGRGDLLPVVASWRAPGVRARAARRRDHVDAAVGRPALPRCPRPASPCCSGPRDVDLLILLALGSRGYDAALPEHVADLFHGALDRHGLGPADAALAIGAPAGPWVAAGQALRRVRRSAGAATGAAGRALARRAPPRRRRPPARPARFAGARRVRRRAARPAAGRRRAAHARAAGDAGGLPGGGRPQGGGGARAAPRAPVAVPAAAPDRGGARRVAGRRGRHARPAPRGARAALPRARGSIGRRASRRAGAIARVRTPTGGCRRTSAVVHDRGGRRVHALVRRPRGRASTFASRSAPRGLDAGGLTEDAAQARAPTRVTRAGTWPQVPVRRPGSGYCGRRRCRCARRPDRKCDSRRASAPWACPDRLVDRTDGCARSRLPCYVAASCVRYGGHAAQRSASARTALLERQP